MTISYKWLSEYLPVTVDPERLSRILTSIGLEVESLSNYQEVAGELKGLVIAKVESTEKHPGADKLTITKVNTGNDELLTIVCGAPNVAAGQKVVVAKVGTTIYPTNGEPLTMKVAKIRNVESHGMICAEDEIGLGTSHAGIIVLPDTAIVGTPALDFFKPYSDWIYEIGLTPNRMDAMSHWGVARDVCAYLSHHDRKGLKPKLPNGNDFKIDNSTLPIEVIVEDSKACRRYCGLSIDGITISQSPKWLREKLKAIGLRPINNIVDITNYIQHETGQPLHAYDMNAIADRKIFVKKLPDGSLFTTLDGNTRKLTSDDLMVCNSKEGMCIAGVFGGSGSGVTEDTKSIFLEAAWFDPITIRKTSFRHGLRTDAASRFEKGTDISATVVVLKRAAFLIKEICGGKIASEVIDIYPDPGGKTEVAIKYHYLKKLSGKNYHPDAVKDILNGLGFDILKEGIDELRVAVPYSKPDISLPADLVEEVLRIDGLDNIEIPGAITITPSVEEDYAPASYKDKIADYLPGIGFSEILTNSITNSSYFSEEELHSTVRLLNNLSAELDILRPSMLETGLQAIAHNLNRKNHDLRFFEFGKIYSTVSPGQYKEHEHLCLYASGNSGDFSWREKAVSFDFYRLKGVITKVLNSLGLNVDTFEPFQHSKFEYGLHGKINNEIVFQAGAIAKTILQKFEIRQPVFFADLDWEVLVKLARNHKTIIRQIPKFPAVFRDLAMVVPKQMQYQEVERSVDNLQLSKLHGMKLFDIFESEKLGTDKKSLAVSFTFLDEEKTLTDKEIDAWMNKIMTALETEVDAVIRK